MTVEVGIIIAVGGFILSVLTYIAGTRKTSKDDGMELGQFVRRNKKRT